ncbi:T9SS type A sorting domain-containing protein [Dyadobacter sp. CY312]|uniref:T9SS type A sorting domain-containing protein n=1 Tax=Dyadobacter sp. CY312 TaxID=2907303 RepID=UPI001F19870C|nr:T9SS type A sorting domain-containing protein [Dyadobacter sp. CY312]MCE7044537.1 T9SS type A sorting domain-containing protein [Dyadobacter sp. CY312]
MILLSLLGGMHSADAQTPGGVSANLRVWLRSDNGFTPASWTDGSGNNNHYTQTNAGRQPFVAADYYNFNPVVDFGTSGSNARFMVVPVGKPYSANGTSSSVFTVNLDRAVGGYGDIIGFGSTTTTASLINANNPVFTRLGTNVVNYPYSDASPALPPVQVNKLYINDVSFTVGSAGIKYGQNGTTGANTQTFTTANSKHADGSVLGSQPEVRNGLIGEVIAYERDLTEAEKQRVRTYTAIKYGITLPHNYIASNGTSIIWDQATNAGYNNNIAGIARDVNGALHQKQSRSINDGKQVLIGTAGLANTNALNTTGLTDGQFLVWGDNGLAKAPSIMVSDFGTDVNARFASIWKVQNAGTGVVRVAWPKGLDNLKLIQSSDAVIDGGDVVTAMSAETAPINGIVYNYADVTLADGQFFTFAAKVSAPGGVVADLRVWLKSDNGFTASQWNDFSGNANHYTQTNASRQPFTATTAYNFNPVIDFGTTGSNARFMAIPAGKPYSANGTSSSVFTVNLDRGVGGYADILGFGATTTTASLINANNPVFTRLWGNVVNYPYSDASPALPAVAANKLYLNDVSFTVGVSGIKYGQNGTTGANTQTFAAGNSKHADGSILGSQPEERNGLIGEVIAYERDLTEAEKQRVRTYTAIKYGITLPHNYVASNENVIWDQGTNAGYNKNIAGLSSDEGSALVQKQSQSINGGQQVLISTTGLDNTNADNGTALTNGQHLVWGDNGLSKSLGVPFTGVPALNLRFASIWKVQNTSSVGTVRVAWPAGITALTLVQSTDAVFDATDTRADMSANTQIVNGLVYNYADVTLGNGQFFTFAGFIAGPGGVGTDLSLWYKADNGVTTDGNNLVTEWATTTTSAVNLTPNGSAVLPYNDQTTYNSTWNFNPTVSFNGSNNYLRNTTIAYLNTAGSVHYITVARNPARNATTRSLFAIAGNDDGFFHTGVGGNTAFPTIGNNYNVAAAAIPTPNNYGIYSAILPKTGSPANQRGFYNGLKKVYPSPYPYTASYTLPTTGAYMGADGTTGDNFNGDIAEVVLYHNTTGGDMLDTDLARIHSYLALKYGITLDQTVAQNYVNSSGAVVWDAVTTNTGYNNHIAGIGKDDLGSLNQKQSRSVNSGNQVLISTTGLQNTNATNTGVVANGQFLIWGDNGLAKAPTVAFTGISGVNHRFASVWKAQNTGSVGTVRVAWRAGYANLNLLQGNDPTFAGGYTATPMTNTQTVNGIEYAYADVTITNGQYFTFAAQLQGPGGVTAGILMWHKANDGVVAAGNKAVWNDISGNGRDVSQEDNTDREPLLVTDAEYAANSRNYFFNFNPFYYFDGGDALYRNNDGYFPSANSPGSVYGIVQNGSGGTRTPYAFSDGDNRPSLTLVGSEYRAYYANLSYISAPGSYATSTMPAHLGSISWIGANTPGISIGVNGHTATGTAAGNTVAINPNGPFIIGSERMSLNESHLGGLPEVFAYSIDHQNSTGNEKQRINSYLAIKYGITLKNDNATGVPNYLSSSSAVVWDGTANAGFSENIAGLANDLMSALHQKQSRSVNLTANGQVTIGLGAIAATNAANANSLNDGQFLLWGDNGNTQAMTDVPTTYTAFNYAGGTNNARRMNRVWKVQNTNATNEVQLRFPTASVGTTTFAPGVEPCAQYVLLTASDAAFTTNVVAKPLVVNGANYDLLTSFPNGASYFTFAKVTPLSSGVVYLPSVVETTVETSDNCSIVSAWTYFRKTGDASLKLLATSGVVTTPLTVTITPEGTTYDDGARTTKVMPRISTVTDNTAGTYSGVKVRVYYSQDELDNTIVAGAVKNGWYKFEGDADAAIADVYADGLLNPALAIEVVPATTGVEDGVRYVEFHGITAFSSFIYVSTTEDSALPVTLANFNVSRNEDKVVLNWATTSEKNSKSFSIERSADAKSWNTLGQVASTGESASLNTYKFDDLSPLSGINYYRLKMIDQDDTYAYSSIRSIRMDGVAGVVLYPNPVSSRLFFKDVKAETVNRVLVYDNSGRLHVELSKIPVEGVNISSLSSGIYIVVLKMTDGSVSRHKITVQK